MLVDRVREVFALFILAKLREALRPRLLHKVTHYYISIVVILVEQVGE